jgi:hypothetical protein
VRRLESLTGIFSPNNRRATAIADGPRGRPNRAFSTACGTLAARSSGRNQAFFPEATTTMIRKLSTGKYRLYSKKIDPKTGKRKNLGTFDTREAATEHERAVQYFKHQH